MRLNSMQLSYIFLIILISCIYSIPAKRITAQIPQELLDRKDNQQYHDLMDRELQILKRQNPNMQYDRPKNDQNVSRENETLMQLEKMRNLQEEFKQEKKVDTESLLKDLKLPIFDNTGIKCEKTMNFNRDDSHIYNNLSTEEQLKLVQADQLQTKQTRFKSSRDTVIENLNNQHSICYFGSTTTYYSLAFKNYFTYCENHKNTEFNNKDFQTLIKSTHIKTHLIEEKYHFNYNISCGVKTIEVTHGASNSLSQYISYLCFDPQNNNQEQQQQQQITDL